MPRMARGTGTSLGGGVEMSPARKSRAAAKRRREEKRWARKSGPVVSRQVDPEQLQPGRSIYSDSPPSPPSA
jgi:hypothetical protein